MIDGLKLTIAGTELRERLDGRIRCHQSHVEFWERELTRTIDDQTDDEPLLPEHMAEHERDAHNARMAVLTLIRDHVVTSESYRLGEEDLRFADLVRSLDEDS